MSYVELDELVEEHGEAEAEVLFEQFRNTPPPEKISEEFGLHVVNTLPLGMAEYTGAEWVLENPDSDTYLQWCERHDFYFPWIKSKGSIEVGDNHYYTFVESDEDGGETWKRNGDAIEYIKEMVIKLDVVGFHKLLEE